MDEQKKKIYAPMISPNFGGEHRNMTVMVNNSNKINNYLSPQITASGIRGKN
jgi:hypothetical protein